MQKGDFVTVDFRAELDGEPWRASRPTDFVFEVGAGRIFAEVEEAVVGMNAGEEQDVPARRCPKASRTIWRGKTVDFTITLKEIKEKVLPALTDEWASEVSEFATLLELRAGDPEQDRRPARAYSADQRFRSAAVKAATDNATLDLPDVVVTRAGRGDAGRLQALARVAGR